MNICLIFANKDRLPCGKTFSHIYCLHVCVHHTGMNTCAYMQMHMDMCVFRGHRLTMSVYLSHSLFCFVFFFLSQDLSLNLELAKSARLACSQAQGTCCLWSPSTVITGICCSTHFFQCMFHGMEHLPSCLCIMQHMRNCLSPRSCVF